MKSAEAIPPDAERQFAQRMGATTSVEPRRDGLALRGGRELIERAAASVGMAAAR